MNPEPEGTINGYWMPTIVVDQNIPLRPRSIAGGIRTKGVDARVFFWPLSMLSVLGENYGNQVSYSLYRRAIIYLATRYN